MEKPVILLIKKRKEAKYQPQRKVNNKGIFVLRIYTRFVRLIYLIYSLNINKKNSI